MIRFDIGKFFPADDGDEEKSFRSWLESLGDVGHIPSGVISQDALDEGLVLYCRVKKEDVNAKVCNLCENKFCPICYIFNYCHKLELQIEIMYNRFAATHAVFVCNKCGAEVFIPKPEAKNKKYAMCRWCQGGRMYRRSKE